jgi:hypothetical protein
MHSPPSEPNSDDSTIDPVIAEAASAIKCAMRVLPELTASGIGTRGKCAFALEGVAQAIAFLRRCKPASANPGVDTRQLLRDCERWTYTSTGELICAALYLGIEVATPRFGEATLGVTLSSANALPALGGAQQWVRS